MILLFDEKALTQFLNSGRSRSAQTDDCVAPRAAAMAAPIMLCMKKPSASGIRVRRHG